MTGSGTLDVSNSSADFRVFNRSTLSTGNGATHMATLDMSGLAVFSADIANLEVGAGSGNDYARGTLYLAPDTDIVADNVYAGYNTGWNNDAAHLILGSDTVMYTTHIGVGELPAKGYVYFDSEVTNPELIIRGKSGGETRASMDIGTRWFAGSTGNNAVGSLDLNGGAVDAMIGTLRMGATKMWGGGWSSSGTLSFDNGTIDATSIILAHSANGQGYGTINVGSDATLRADTITMAGNSYSNRYVEATMNLNGGVVESSTIQLGQVGSATQLARLFFNSGTIRNKADGNLTISGLTAFDLTGASAAHTFEAQDGYSISVDSPMSGTGGFTKTGEGTLALSGDNGYTGNTTVNAGTLTLTHGTSSNTIADSPVITLDAGTTLDVSGLAGGGIVLASGQTLQGGGTVSGGTTVSSGASLIPGSSPGFMYTDDLTIAGGSNLYFDIWGTTPGSGHDQVVGSSGSSLSFGDGWILNLCIRPPEPITGTLKLFDGFDTPYSGFNPAAINILSGRADTYEFNYEDGTIYLVNAVPEPASLALFGLGALTLLRRRRR